MRFLMLSAVLFSCGTAVGGEVCDEIGERCHAAGVAAGGTAEQKECHDKAHKGWSEAQCVSERTRCLALCPLPPDAGP